MGARAPGGAGPGFLAGPDDRRDDPPAEAKAEPKPSWILVIPEPVTDVDTTASDMLTELDESLNAQGISLVFTELKDPVRRKIERYGLTRAIDLQHFCTEHSRSTTPQLRC